MGASCTHHVAEAVTPQRKVVRRDNLDPMEVKRTTACHGTPSYIRFTLQAAEHLLVDSVR